MLFEYSICIQAGIKSPDKNTSIIEFKSKWHFDANFVANTKTLDDNDSSLQFRILPSAKLSALNKTTITKDKKGNAVMYVSMIQQHSWNDKTKSGSFKENAKNPEKSGTIKLSANEAGEILSSFKTRIPFLALPTLFCSKILVIILFLILNFFRISV